MKRFALAAVAVVALTGSLTATAAQTPSPRHHTPPGPCAHHRHPAAEQRRLAHRVFALTNWRSPEAGQGAYYTMKRLRGCVEKPTREAMARTWKAARADVFLQHRYRIVATEPGFVGEGRFLRWLPIPAYIVACETRGSFGEERWQAVNGETAAQGPAQLNGWPAPFTPDTPEEKVAYWEETAYVWDVSGPAAWACA